MYKITGQVKDAQVGAFLQFPWRDTQEEKETKSSKQMEKESLREQVAAIISGLRLVEPTEDQLYDIKKSVLRLLILHFHWDRLRQSTWTATFHQQDSEMAARLKTDPARVEEEDPFNILIDFVDNNEMTGSWTWSGRDDEEDSGFERRFMVPAGAIVNLFKFLYLPPYTVSPAYRNVRWTSWRDTEEINTAEFARFYQLFKGISGGVLDGQNILLLFFVQTALMDKNGKDVVYSKELGLDAATQDAVWMTLEKNRYNFEESSNTDAMWARRSDLMSSWAVIMERLLVVSTDKSKNQSLEASDLLPTFHSAKPKPIARSVKKVDKDEDDEDEDKD